mgnify:CR=1 FL=1|tara:strand:+ start:9233 stop:9466 length:234 start_codon:yes stop_codon:yes gene_type:complete
MDEGESLIFLYPHIPPIMVERVGDKVTSTIDHMVDIDWDKWFPILSQRVEEEKQWELPEGAPRKDLLFEMIVEASNG